MRQVLNCARNVAVIVLLFPASPASAAKAACQDCTGSGCTYYNHCNETTTTCEGGGTSCVFTDDDCYTFSCADGSTQICCW